MTNPSYPALRNTDVGPINAATLLKLDPIQANVGRKCSKAAKSDCEKKVSHAPEGHQNLCSMHRPTQP
jgi:hypothetical protein